MSSSHLPAAKLTTGLAAAKLNPPPVAAGVDAAAAAKLKPPLAGDGAAGVGAAAAPPKAKAGAAGVVVDVTAVEAAVELPNPPKMPLVAAKKKVKIICEERHRP